MNTLYYQYKYIEEVCDSVIVYEVCLYTQTYTYVKSHKKKMRWKKIDYL